MNTNLVEDKCIFAFNDLDTVLGENNFHVKKNMQIGHSKFTYQ